MKGFITAPSAEDLKPTPAERYLLEQLWNWQEASANSPVILGVPLESQPPHNPERKR